MRIQISFDSAPTEQVRECAAALHRIGKTGTLTVGLNGPEAWCGKTPHLTPNEFAVVACTLIKFQDRPVAELLDELRKVVAA